MGREEVPGSGREPEQPDGDRQHVVASDHVPRARVLDDPRQGRARAFRIGRAGARALEDLRAQHRLAWRPPTIPPIIVGEAAHARRTHAPATAGAES
jgi:hypothetical protein